MNNSERYGKKLKLLTIPVGTEFYNAFRIAAAKHNMEMAEYGRRVLYNNLLKEASNGESVPLPDTFKKGYGK